MASRLARGSVIAVVTMCMATRGFAADSLGPKDCAGREAVPNQIRPLDCPLVALLADGLRRSATLQRIVERIGELQGIVYINEGHYLQARTGRALDGALSHEVSMAGAHTVLRVTLALDRGDRPIVTLAHELQHAIEVLESPEARTEAAVDALFERIGAHAYNGIAETGRAIEVERTVARELADSQRAAGRR